VGGYERPGAWVRRVAINLALSDHRRRASERRALDRLRLVRSDDGPGGDGGAAVVGADRFWEAVRTLPPQQRAAVVLRYVDDRSVSEISEVLDVAEGTAKAHLHKARAALARQFALETEEER
jgi:RNA polymerase sigma-70 factor (ECF subfamily)